MKFALVNPQWSWEGSTYFGSQAPVVPLELLGAAGVFCAAPATRSCWSTRS